MITPKQREKIVHLRTKGYTQQRIAEEIGISRQTVSYHLKKMKKAVTKKQLSSSYIENSPPKINYNEKEKPINLNRYARLVNIFANKLPPIEADLKKDLY